MHFNRQYVYSRSEGEDIYLFTLRNTCGTEVIITNYGAIICSFKIKNRDGTVNDIVLGFDNPEDYCGEKYLSQYPWFGCAVGRYANRIKDAAFSIDGKYFQLSKNSGNNQLHGGHEGFDKKVWKFILSGALPNPFLVLGYRSPDGEEGYPGNLDVMIRFELNDENELSYQYTATSDQPTPVNLTHHSYFNLHNGEGTIHDHEIKIYSSGILEQDENLAPTGNILPVKDTVYDFCQYRRISDRLAIIPEFDNSFIADNKDNNGNLRLMAEARLQTTGTILQVFSTDKVVHFYTGKWIPAVKGKNEIMYGPFSGFCLETHNYLNAVNIPHFPTTILRPGETYYQKTVYKIIQTAEK